MIKYIIENKEWLFSGLGLSVITILVIGVKATFNYKVKRNSNEPSKKNEIQNIQLPFDHSPYRKRPYPSEIRDEINNAPPLQRDAVIESYIGLKVTWLTTFETAHGPSPKGIVRLMLLDRGSYPWVNCNVNLNQYPELKSAKAKSEILISGTIKNLDSGSIELIPDFIHLQ